MNVDPARLANLFECAALVTRLGVGLVARWLAQRIGLAQAIGRRRLAEVAAVLADLRFKLLQPLPKRQYDALKLAARERGEIGRSAFLRC